MLVEVHEDEGAEPEPDKVLADIKANKDADRVINGQKKVRALREQKLKNKKEIEKAIADLDKIAKDFSSTFAAKEADEFRTELIKRKNAP